MDDHDFVRSDLSAKFGAHIPLHRSDCAVSHCYVAGGKEEFSLSRSFHLLRSDQPHTISDETKEPLSSRKTAFI